MGKFISEYDEEMEYYRTCSRQKLIDDINMYNGAMINADVYLKRIYYFIMQIIDGEKPFNEENKKKLYDLCLKAHRFSENGIYPIMIMWGIEI
jgi:hypothetical protein